MKTGQNLTYLVCTVVLVGHELVLLGCCIYLDRAIYLVQGSVLLHAAQIRVIHSVVLALCEAHELLAVLVDELLLVLNLLEGDLPGCRSSCGATCALSVHFKNKKN